MDSPAGSETSAIAQWLVEIGCGSEDALLWDLQADKGAVTVEDLTLLEDRHIDELCESLRPIPARKFRSAVAELRGDVPPASPAAARRSQGAAARSSRAARSSPAATGSSRAAASPLSAARSEGPQRCRHRQQRDLAPQGDSSGTVTLAPSCVSRVANGDDARRGFVLRVRARYD